VNITGKGDGRSKLRVIFRGKGKVEDHVAVRGEEDPIAPTAR